MTRTGFWYLFLLLVLLGGGLAQGKTELAVDVGWEGRFRPGDWTPIYITIADPSPRNVILELHAPHDMLHEMSIRQFATAQPTPVPYALYAPLGGNLTDASLVVRDAATHRVLTRTLLADPTQPSYQGPRGGIVESQALFIGVSGRSRTVRQVRGSLEQSLSSTAANRGREMLASAVIEPLRLPAVAVGYESLDALILDAPDLAALTAEQQQAITDWVRAGGNLILWPGPDPVPTTGPLIDILPGSIGEVASVTLGPTERKHNGLSDRFTTLPVRLLRPAADAASGLLLGNSTLLRHRVGLGNVELLSLDAGQLQFDDPQAAGRFWKSILQPLVKWPNADASPGGYYVYSDDPRHTAAVQGTMDLLGNVPGVGQFGFSYVAYTLIALMLIVGPVDWLILRRLGRLHWTWLTTSVWIVLVTTGAIFIGHVLKSGELHFRTLDVIDQAGGQTVGTTRMIGIYSPRTTDYTIDTPPRGWWQPPSSIASYFSSSAGAVNVPFHQDYRGNRPESMLINVWNLRFLEDTDYDPGPAQVDTDLHLRSGSGNGRPHVAGTLTNRSTLPLKNVQIRTRAGVATLSSGPLAPGASMTVDAPLNATNPFAQPPLDPNQYYPRPPSTPALPDTLSYVTAGNLDLRRAQRIDRLLEEHDDLACVYGQYDNVQPDIHLAQPGALQKHWRMIRAIVPLD